MTGPSAGYSPGLTNAVSFGASAGKQRALAIDLDQQRNVNSNQKEAAFGLLHPTLRTEFALEAQGRFGGQQCPALEEKGEAALNSTRSLLPHLNEDVGPASYTASGSLNSQFPEAAFGPAALAVLLGSRLITKPQPELNRRAFLRNAAASGVGLGIWGASKSFARGGSEAEMEPYKIDTIEVNHCYNRDTGQRRFIQIIYWDYDAPGDTVLHVREWHMLEKCQMLCRLPDGESERLYPYLVIRNKDGDMQIIRANNFKVTHTFGDPEELDRRARPVEARRPIK